MIRKIQFSKTRKNASVWQEEFKETSVSLTEDFKGDSVPFGREKSGMSITVLIQFFLCGEASNETGRFRGGGIQRGQGLPWHTILLARSSVLYLLRQGAAKGTCDGAAQGPFGDPGQAGFAGLPPENARAFEKQSPPGRQRMRALGWSEAEEKRAQPGRRRYINALVLRLTLTFFPSDASLRFFIFRFLTRTYFHILHFQSNSKRSLFSNSDRIVFEKTSPEISFPFTKNVCGMESRRCISAVSSIPRARLSDK